MINQSRFKSLHINPERVRELIKSIEEQENEIKEMIKCLGIVERNA